MDRAGLIGIVEQKHHLRVDPNDPVFTLATVAEVLQAEARAELQKIVGDAANQMAAANVQAEAAARAKAEAIVTRAGEWAAGVIKKAGEGVVEEVRSEREKAEETVAQISRWVRWAVIAAVVCGTSALAAALSVGVAVWVG